MVTAKKEKPVKYSVRNPFCATVTQSIQLCALSPIKNIRHIEVSLKGSGLRYTVGDSLGVLPLNLAPLVDETLEIGKLDGDFEVKTPRDGVMPLREAMLRSYDITKPSPKFLNWVAKQSGDEELLALTESKDKKAINDFLWGREVIDLLLDYPFDADIEEFVSHLKPLQPRLYSIASSQLEFPEEAHLTIALVNYTSFNRNRWGVCTYNLCELFNVGDQIPVFVSVNRNFRLPEDSDVPIIMVGPGTGIAPFRAFLQERRALGSKGRNWLFFGNPYSKTDFLYRDDFFEMQRQGVLHRFDTAFSRDQETKIYVQHRLLENSRDIYDWLENGAYFYVCGDAERMAKDVHDALHKIVQDESGCSREQAEEYVKRLDDEKRCQRDVY